ncbi:hypothetical protein RHSIM_Rhsim07G0045400 [Rhododendron simsii]|uniref:DUF4220 domain-containing protein n=1 Tax=Rhododendron simsii TaxID=118357 RepID=A0A834GNN7_RHOSS|nr:hypothetical protein RHSIM_Rhsim07G0045400 [Rhododendron simsii]
MPCYRICKKTKDYNNMRALRKWWEEWDLRILILYILIAQLYLLFVGRLRRKNNSLLMMIVSVWLLYLFSDLLATIALGKLSKIKVDDPVRQSNNIKMGEESLRVMWAPLVLFYLGGPDTITVLRAEENQLWLRHLIGLLTQGLRTAYALIVTWNKEGLSLLALLVFVPGIVKYGERVWVVRSRSKDYKGFVQLDNLDSNKMNKMSASRPNAIVVLNAYSCFLILKPHNTSSECDVTRVGKLWKVFRDSVQKDSSVYAFKLIEIELGLMYDMLFSKVGTIFTVWGRVLRFLSFSLIVSVLVIYITCDKPHGHLEGDHIVTIILLAGAIFLEIAGISVQLASDWAVVWACKHIERKWATWVLFLHEILISKSPRWSGEMGQFSLREYCKNDKPLVINEKWEWLFGREKMLKRFNLGMFPGSKLKELIIGHLREKSEKAKGGDTLQTSTNTVTHVDTSQTSTQKIANVNTVQTSIEKATNVDELPTSELKRGEWTFLRYGGGQQFKQSIGQKLGQSIVIWHVATEVCYESDHDKSFGKELAKKLSDYMMYLLVACPDRFPFCNKYNRLKNDFNDMKKLFRGAVLNERNTMKGAQRLVEEMKENPKRWDIMGSIWVEMLCDAATNCPVKNHIQELRHGGEFLTHVWLLLLHFGTPKELERSKADQKDEKDSGAKATISTGADIAGNQIEEGEKDIQVTNLEELYRLINEEDEGANDKDQGEGEGEGEGEVEGDCCCSIL